MKRSPAAAVWLSLVPGAGHLYAGQVTKGFILILLAAGAIQIASEGDGPFGIVIPFIWLYGMLDAHRSAVEVNRILASGGQLPPSTGLDLSKWWGYLLIGMGGVLILENFGLIDFDWIWDLWPLGLIGLGLYILKRREEPRTDPLPPAPPPATTDAGPESEDRARVESEGGDA